MAALVQLLRGFRLSAENLEWYGHDARTRMPAFPEFHLSEPWGTILHYEFWSGYDWLPLTEKLLSQSETRPVQIWTESEPIGVWSRHVGPIYWFYQSALYRTNDVRLTPEDVRALINEAENTRRLRLEKAHALQAMRERSDTRAKRQPIPQDVKVTVWQRDGGRCVECGLSENLEFDHIIPLAMGGSNTMRNLQLLCGDCNRRKGATLG